MSNIWVPKVGVIEAELSQGKIGVAGQYTIKKFHESGALVAEYGPFDNLITNAGLDRVGTSNWNSLCFVGTGTATPAVSNTQLGVFLAQTSSRQIAWAQAAARGGSPDYWVQSSVTFSFGLGVATGTLTEVGIGWDPGGGPPSLTHRCFSRALIVDSGGSPVSITVLATEYLDVTYSMRFYPPLGADSVQTVVISGVNYTFTTRACGVLNNMMKDQPFNWGGLYWACSGTGAGTPPTLGTVTDTGLANKGSNTFLTVAPVAYVANSLTGAVTLSAGLADCNMPYGIRGLETIITAGGSGFVEQRFQTTVSPAIPKDNTKVLTFGASLTWGRH